MVVDRAAIALIEARAQWGTVDYNPTITRWQLVEINGQLCAVDTLGIFPPVCITPPIMRHHPDRGPEVVAALERLYPRTPTTGTTPDNPARRA